MIRLETSRKNYLRGVAVDRKIIEWLVPRFAKLALAKNTRPFGWVQVQIIQQLRRRTWQDTLVPSECR